MSNDSISLTLGIDHDSIEEGTILMVSAFGSEDEEDIRVEVVKENTIVTVDFAEVKAYLVEKDNGHQFIAGDGEIVSIVEDEEEEDTQEEVTNDKEITMEWS